MLELTVIVPTMNEADNIAPLVARLAAALTNYTAEILFVDDSSDNTVETIAHIAQSAPLPVRCIARPPAERDGLSGAVVQGLQATSAAWVCVIDGDLQHPPEVVPLLLERGKVSSAEIVVASRQANRLGPVGLTRSRSLISNGLTLFARALFPRSLKDVSDPLTGFFLVKRSALDISRLRPDGFKILLEILVRHPDLRASELFFDFALRHAGTSKADLREGARFFRHVLRLRLSVHRLPLLRHAAVSGSSLAVSVGILQLLTKRKWSLLPAAWVATLIGDGWRWLGRRQLLLPKRERAYHLGNRFWLASGAFATFVILPVLWVLRVFGRIQLTAAYLLTLATSGFVRYMLSDRWVWTRGLVGTQPTHTVYNLHGKIYIHSPVSLPDLAFFQSADAGNTPDITIRIDRHGTPRQFENTVSFDDHLGRFGFAFTLDPATQPIEVVISPVIAQAPHVLYVNIILPLLRYLSLERDMLLLRCGAVTTDEGMTLLVANKPEQVMQRVFSHLEHNHTTKYASHDWTWLDAEGNVYAFPNALTMRKLLDLPRQRRWGAKMRQIPQLPAATLNALVQRLFPPLQVPIVQRIPRERIAQQGRLVAVAGVGLNSAEKITDHLLQLAIDPLGFPLFDMLLDHNPQALRETERQRLLSIMAQVIREDR